MSHHFNYEFKFVKGTKTIFVQNDEGLKRGQTVLQWFEKYVTLPITYFHYRSGGHVAALHSHLSNEFFFKIDLKDFFYSIPRNRVARALHNEGFKKARDYAKWSCVKHPNPGSGASSHVLPIGFVQSPALASLVLMRSPVQKVLEEAAAKDVYVSLYLDDIIGSASNPGTLQSVFDAVLAACAAASLPISASKLIAPTASITAFNCALTAGHTEVTPERVAKFYDIPRSAHASGAFERYRSWIAQENVS